MKRLAGMLGRALSSTARWWPQVAVGLSWKHNRDYGLVPKLLGARRRSDIEGYVAARLANAGVVRIECLGQDTYSQPDRFFSYRRSCHRGEEGYGRQISVIGLRA